MIAREPLRHTLPYVLLLAGMVAVLYKLALPAVSNPGWPPNTASRPAQVQIEALALKPGDVFRGRSITLLQMNAEGFNNWDVFFYPVLVLKYQQSLGYEFTNDARAMGVPVANEFGHWISPPMLALLAAAFYNPKDVIGRATQAPRVFRPHLARLLGVALVVSDSPIPGETRLYEGLAGDHPVYIHGVAGANVGQYSPTRTVHARNAGAILDQLQAPGFDGRDIAIVENPLADDLVRAQRVAMRFEKGPAIRVSAYSAGTSLLVLPIDFSHCLKAAGAGLVRMLPVNLAQTGLLVRGEFSVEIRYRYGMVSGTSCRKQDLKRITDLGLENAATGRLFHDSR